MNIKKLLRPDKIALVGATEKDTMAGFTSRMLIEHCQDRLDDVYFISLTNESVFGKKCYSTIEEIPTGIDLAILCTPQSTITPLLEQASIKGAKGAVVFASGYSETGNPRDIQMEEELLAYANKHKIAVMGPNCAGFINFVDKIFSFGFMFKAQEAAGNIGLISQSGQVCMALMESSKANFSYVISAGNSKIVTMEDYLDFLVEDDNTEVIAMYLEGIQKPKKFAKVLRKAAQKCKPIVVLKAGRSQKGASAAQSHTGSLSGTDKNIDAVFKKFGAVRVDDIEELSTVSAAFATLPALPKRNAFAFVNISGGETTVSADSAYIYGLDIPDFNPETITKLEQVIPTFATAQNPMDITGGATGEDFEKAIEIILDSPEIEMLITSLQITEEISDITIYDFLNGLIRYMENGNGKPVAVVPLIDSGRNVDIVERLKKVGVPILPPPNYGYKALNYIIDYVNFLETKELRSLEVSCPLDLRKCGSALSEHESKQILKNFGINVTDEIVAKTELEAVNAACKLGFPVVMKIESNDILHKSDIGGVRLNVSNQLAVEKYYKEIIHNAKVYKPEAKVNGVLVQKMCPKGFEVIIGVNNDSQFGPIVLLGIGGVFTEVFKDVTLYPAPFGRDEALMMINNLKGSKMFYGYRGQSKCDVLALADTLVAVSNLAVSYKDKLIEMDINPVIVYEEGKGVIAVDGLIILSE